MAAGCRCPGQAVLNQSASNWLAVALLERAVLNQNGGGLPLVLGRRCLSNRQLAGRWSAAGCRCPGQAVLNQTERTWLAMALLPELTLAIEIALKHCRGRSVWLAVALLPQPARLQSQPEVQSPLPPPPSVEELLFTEILAAAWKGSVQTWIQRITQARDFCGVD